MVNKYYTDSENSSGLRVQFFYSKGLQILKKNLRTLSKFEAPE